MPNVLIIIVTWNKCQDVLRLLTSLKAMAYPSSMVDVIVVDNASDDGTAEAVTDGFADVELIRNPQNLGGSGGFNTGLQRAYEMPEGTYDYLWLLDNDVVVHRRALCELVSVLESHNAIDIVGSTMLKMEKPWVIHEMGGFLNRKNGRFRLNLSGKKIQAYETMSLETLVRIDRLGADVIGTTDMPATVDFVAAASMLVRWKRAKQNGLFRNYFIHFDDVEWCLRMKKRGGRVAASAASLIWHKSSSSQQIPEWVYYYNNRNLLDLLRDYGEQRGLLYRMKWWIWIKALLFALGGKLLTSYYHRKAIHDFEHHLMGEYDAPPPGLWYQICHRWPKPCDIYPFDRLPQRG